MKFYLCLWNSIFVYISIFVYGVLSLYMEVGCIYAVVGCTYMETFGCGYADLSCMSMECKMLGACLKVGSLPDSR